MMALGFWKEATVEAGLGCKWSFRALLPGRAALLCSLLVLYVFGTMAVAGCGGRSKGEDDNNVNTSDQDGAVPDGAPDSDATVPDASEDQAEFVSQQVPSSVSAGENFVASFVLRNTGTSTWSEADLYRLGSEAPLDNQTWGTGRIHIPGGVNVFPGETHSFEANLTAPASPGQQVMQWRMVREHVRWFGEPTAELVVNVTDACQDHCANGVRDCGEAYIDCGGPCAPCDPVEVAPRVSRAQYFSAAVAPDGRVMIVWTQPHQDPPGSTVWSCFDGQGFSTPARTAPDDPADMSISPPSIVSDAQGMFHLVHDLHGGDWRRIHYNRWDSADCTGGWHSSAEVVPRMFPYNVNYPSVGVDELGQLLVTYSQAVAGQSEVFGRACGGTEPPCPEGYHCYPNWGCVMNWQQHFSRRTGGTFGSGQWTDPAAIGTNHGTHAHHGSVFVENSTMAHAVWMHDSTPGDHQIYYAQWNGSSWSTPCDVGLWAHIGKVQAFGDEVYVLSNQMHFTWRNKAGGAWSSPISIAGGADWEINFFGFQVGADGRHHAVWNSAFRIMYAVTDSTGNWLPPKAVSPSVINGQRYAHEPSLAVDQAGVAHIVWGEASCSDYNQPCSMGAVMYLATRYEEL